MANITPEKPILIIDGLRDLARGIAGAAAVWPANTPSQAMVDAAADTMESLENDVEAAYAEYKRTLAARNAYFKDTARPMYRRVVETAYFVVGQDNASLLSFGLQPRREPAPPSSPPDPPTALVAKEISPTSIQLDWRAVRGANRYQVYCGTDLDDLRLVGSASKSRMDISNLTEGTKYFFQVTAFNSAGESQRSATTSARPG